MRLPLAILSAVAVALFTALPLAWLGQGLSGWHGGVSWIALSLGLCALIGAWKMIPSSKYHTHPESNPESIWEWLMIGIFTCASARAFLWLIYENGDQWSILSPNNLGDLALHLSFIHWLAATQHWWPASPILVGDPLRYPLGSDLFNSLLLIAGVPVRQGLVGCALIGAGLTGYALWRWGRGIALAALLFNGGFAGIVFFQGGDPDAVSEWKNLFLTLFVTQRGFLFALPAGLFLLTTWREENFSKDRKREMPLPIQVLFLAVMPLFSIHTALYLGVAMVGILLIAPASRKSMGKLAICSWPLMALFGWLVATGAGGPSAVHALGWHPGWMSDGSMRFWFWNFGVSLPLSLVLVLLLLRANANQEARAFVWPAAFIFICCLLVRFAPWPWDNMKLMLWSWIVIAPYLWGELIQKWQTPVRVVAFLLLFTSGALSLESGLDGKHGYGLVKKSDLQVATEILKKLPPEAVIACAPEYNQPVLMLGHPVVCGYEGHLWSHGLDYQARFAALGSIMQGEAGWQQKAHDLGITVIYWGEMEQIRWPHSQLPLTKGNGPILVRLDGK